MSTSSSGQIDPNSSRVTRVYGEAVREEPQDSISNSDCELREALELVFDMHG